MKYKLGLKVILGVLFLNLGHTSYAEEFETGGGAIPDPTPVIDQPSIVQKTRTLLPSSYDPRNGGDVPVKNQGQRGLCWAFSSTGAIESSLIKRQQQVYDFSELYVDYYFAKNAFGNEINNPHSYPNRVLGRGGQEFYPIYGAINWTLPILEEKMPYITSTDVPYIHEDQLNETADVHVQGMIALPRLSEKYTEQERVEKVNMIKKQVMTNSGVTYQWNEDYRNNAEYYNASNAAFYASNEKQNKNINHSCLIVGWDNDYAKEKFNTQPKSNGAFIVRNSYGEKFGDKGYYYVSYEDYYVATSQLYGVSQVETKDNYETNYSHTEFYNYSPQPTWVDSYTVANVYTPKAKKELLKAISFHTAQFNVPYDLYVIKNADDLTKSIKSEDMIKVASGIKEIPGIETVSLEKPISLNGASKFAVVANLKRPEGVDNFYILTENNYFNIEMYNNVKVNKGESYIHLGNYDKTLKFDDLSTVTSSYAGNAYLNAYTDSTPAIESVEITPKEKTIEVDSSCQLTATVLPENVLNKEVEWTSEDASIATVDQNGEVVGNKAGMTKINATTKEDGVTTAMTLTVKEPITGVFGDVKWRWEEETQTVFFMNQGTFPAATRLSKQIEKDKRLNEKKIKKIVFEQPVELNENSSYLFYGLSELESIEGLTKLNTSKVTNMDSMFAASRSLKQLDLSNWNTSNVTNMTSMFNGTNLEYLDISNWDTSNVTNMTGMFLGLRSLKQLDLSDWDTSKVTNMCYMFKNASSLEQLDVSKWDTSNVTNMTGIFWGASSLKQLDVSNWDTSKVTNMGGMFYEAKTLEQLDVSNWDTSKVTSMYRMFYRAEKIKRLETSNWNTSSVTSMYSMFYEANSLEYLDVSNWDISNITSTYYMFYRAMSLKQLDVSNWNTSKVTNMNSMFNGVNSLKHLDVSNWDTSKVTDMDSMFFGGGSLIQLDVSNWNTSNVTNMASMFQSLASVEQLDVSNWDMSKVTNVAYMFSGVRSVKKLNISNWNTSKITNMAKFLQRASSLKQLDVSKWDISNVTDMNSMFSWTSSLEQLDVSNWNTSKVIRMDSMFNGASSLKQLDVSKWDTSACNYMSDMFNKASLLERLDVSNWNMSKVTNMRSMFQGASSLKRLDVSNWDTSKVTNTVSMFQETRSLEQLDVSNWNMSNVTDMRSMFQGTSSLEQLDVSNWDTSKVIYMIDMFNGASSLKRLDASNWDISKVIYMDNMFKDASSLEQLNISNWDTSKTKYMTDMFSNCLKLNTFVLGSKSILKTRISLSNKKWTNKEKNISYNSTQLFNNYDGSFPGTYVCEDN